MISWMKRNRDELIGKYVIPVAILLGIILLGIVLFVGGRYKKAEVFFKRVLEKIKNLNKRFTNGRI